MARVFPDPTTKFELVINVARRRSASRFRRSFSLAPTRSSN